MENLLSGMLLEEREGVRYFLLSSTLVYFKLFKLSRDLYGLDHERLE